MVDPTPTDDLVGALRPLIASGGFQKALDAFRGAVRAGARLDAEASLLAATAATRVGDLAVAAALADDALGRFRARADDDGRLRVMNLLGAIGFERGQLTRAEACFEEALRPYHNLALAIRQAADLQEAERAAAQAIRHAEVLDDVGLRALTVTGRAELRVQQGEVAFAYQELDRAARLARQAGDPVGGAEVRRVRALAALKERNYDRAAAEAEAARAVPLEHHSALLAAECSAAAALAYRGSGNAELATARRTDATAGLRDLGAAQLLERFDREWGEPA